MSLRPFSSKLKFLAMLIVFALSTAFINAQDSITAFGQTGTARLDVSTNYSFSLSSTNAGASAATWAVTGATVFAVGDVTISGDPGQNVTISFSPNLIDPGNTNKNPNNTYIVTATYGAPSVSTSITVVLLPFGGLITENVTIRFLKLDKNTNEFNPVSSIDLMKGEISSNIANDGETIRVEFAIVPKTPALPLSLSMLRKIGLRAVDSSNADLISVNDQLPPLIQITTFRDSVGNLLNSDIPAVDLPNNLKGSNEFVMFRYAQIPYWYRMDSIDFENNATEPRDNYSYVRPVTGLNPCRELMDPRINYDYFRSKLWLNNTLTEFHIFNQGVTLPATNGNLLTDSTALIDIDTGDTDYTFRPNPVPSPNSLAGANSGIHANRFITNLNGNTASFDLPLKALDHGAVGGIRLLIELFPSETSSTKIMSVPLAINVVAKVPLMTLDLRLDGETTDNSLFVTSVPGKDIVLRFLITRTIDSFNPLIPAYEGPSGAQEYLVVDDNTNDTDLLWIFRNFDEYVFDSMEFDGTLYAAAAAQTANTGMLFYGAADRLTNTWKHHGLHLNVQSFQGTLSNTLFNDIPYLIQNDNNAYNPATRNDGTVMNSNGRYTLTNQTKIGLIRETAPERFMYSQARLYTKDSAAMRESLSAGTVGFSANLFRNNRGNLAQRGVTLVPRVPGIYAINVRLMTADGTQVIAAQTVFLDIIPEIITETSLNPADLDALEAKPVRALDQIAYPDKSYTSAFSEFGITTFSMRMEGIGAQTNMLYDQINGYNGAQSYGEVDLDDLASFRFTYKTNYSFSYFAPNNDANGSVQGIGGRPDLDGDAVSRENFYETTGRPEPVHLQFNGIDDDNDGVVDDRVNMPTGRAESAAIRITQAQRSIEYRGGTLRRYYQHVAMVTQVTNFRSAVSALNFVPTLTPAILNATQAAYPTITSTGITAAFAAAVSDPFLTNTQPGSPRRQALLNAILDAISAYEYNTINYESMVGELVIPNIITGRPRDDFAPIPTPTGIDPIILNTYIGQVVERNQYNVGSTFYSKPIKYVFVERFCDPKEVYFQFTHQIPWVNRNGSTGLIPVTFSRATEALPTGFSFSPSNSVTDKKYVGPFADLNIYPSFTNQVMSQIGRPATYQNFSTRFQFTGGLSRNFINRMTNNYRPFLNMSDYPYPPPNPPATEVQFANFAGLNGWTFNYGTGGSNPSLIFVADNSPQEGKTWVIEQRVGAILDLPDAIYTINDLATFSFVRQNQIIVPEEDHRWRPDDTGLQGFESWYRTFPIREVHSMESNYVALFGIDQAYDPKHTPQNAGVVSTPYRIDYLSPSPAYHEVAGNNTALRLFLPSEMLDNNGSAIAAPFLFFEDMDDSGTFNLAVDLARNTSSIHRFNSLTRTFYSLVSVQAEYDVKYDEQYDFFIVTRFDSGYPDIVTGPPPFNVANQPDSSAVRFGIKVELFKPNSFPKAAPDYLNFMDHDGKDERSTQDNYFVVNVRVNSSDADMVIHTYQDTDHPLDANGLVVLQGSNTVKAMTGRDQIGGVAGSSVTKDLRAPADLIGSTFSDVSQKFGTTTFPFVPFSRTSLSTLILTGDVVNPGFFPISAQGTSSLPSGIMWSHIHLPVLPSAERTANFDRVIERHRNWRNDVYVQVRPFERDKNGNGICDPAEDFNSDGSFTQDVVLLSFKPEVYPAGHPRAGQSFYNATNDFLNMADIRWSIVKNESGGYLSSDTGYLKPGDATGTNYVTYYPGSLNGLDYVKGENIKTGRSLIAAILVRNNPACDGIDNDGDAPLGTFVTTIGSLMGLNSSDPRYSIKCVNPTAVFNANSASALENFPNIDFADDDYLDGAASLDAGYAASPFTNIGTGATNKGNVYIDVTGTYVGLSDISIILTSTYAGTGTVGTNPISFSAAFTDSITTLTTTTTFTLVATGNTLLVYNDTASGSSVTVEFLPIGGQIAFGDTFRFIMLGERDWDADSYTRGQELQSVPAAMYPETISGYSTGLDIDMTWNNPRPFYAIKVRADKAPSESYNGEYGRDYVFTTKLMTKEVVGSGVWTQTVEMALDDMRYLGAGGLLATPPTSLNTSYDATPTYLYFRVSSLVNNTGSSSYTAGNLLVVSENQYYTPDYQYSFVDRVALGGVDLLRITQNSNGVMRGEWRDDTGDVSNYPLAEYCINGPHMTRDAANRSIYDFDIATLPGDHTRYAAAVFESNHTVADYTSAGYGLVRIDPNSMPTPVLQLNAADTSDPVTLTFTDGERLQKIRVNFLNVRAFKPTAITDDPNTRPQDTMLAPLSNDMLGGVSLWKDNKDPGALALLNGKDLITGTLGRSATVGSLGHFDALVDIVVDMDGWDSPRAYTNYNSQYDNPAIPLVGFIPLTSFTTEDKIYFVDRDGSKSFTLGDDIYSDQGLPGLDNGDRIIYTQRGLGTGTSYSLGDPAHAERLRYYDKNRNNKYDNGEDIVYEANNLNARWELPIDKYVPLDKDALRWRWDKENNLWYIVLDLENDEEIPPEDVFVNLLDYVNPTFGIPNLAALNFPGSVPPNFYNGADYHLCIRTSTNMDYLASFMVEIPDYWKHTQALSNFDDISGVWLASQPATVTYPSMPGSSIISPVIVANMPVLISDEAIARASRNRIGRNSKPFSVLGINLVDNTFNSLKMGNDLLKTVFGSNMDSISGNSFGVRLNNISGNRKTVLEDLVLELFNNLEGTIGSVVDATGTIVPGDFNPTSDLLALDRTCKGDDIFRSIDGTGVFKDGDTKILRLGSYLENGRLIQDDLTIGKQGKQDPSIVFVDINSNGVYDDNLDILVYDIDGLTSDGLETGTRTFKFGDAILKRGFSNWDITVGAINDVSKLTPNDLSLIIGKQLFYDSSLWYEDDDESGGFSNEVSMSGVALYRDRSDSSPYDNGKFDSSVSYANETIVLDEVIYLEQIEYTGQSGQPQHQVRMRPAVFDVSSTFLAKVLTNGLADPAATTVDHYVTGIAINAKASRGGTGEDYRDQVYDDLFNPFIDLDNNGVDDSNKLYSYNRDTSLPDHHPLRVNLFQDKISPSYGDENGMGPYGEWGYLRAPLDDGQSSLPFDQARAIVRNTGNKHLGPDFFVVIRTSNVATNGDDFRAGISSWGRDPAHVMNSAAQRELGNRGIGFDDRVEDFEINGFAGGTNSPVPFLYPGPPAGYTGTPFGDVSNSRTYTKFLSSVILVDGLPPEDVKTLAASIYDGGATGPNLVALVDQIRLDWEWENDPDNDRAGVLLVRRKGLAPDLKQLEDGEYYIGPEVTSEKGEERRRYLPGYLGFATKTSLTTAVSAGSLLTSAISSTDVSITHADFASLPVPPTNGKCYLLISAGEKNGKSEVVSYTLAGATIIVKRGELGTTPVAHAANSSVTYMPPRPVKTAELLQDNSPITGSPVVVKVDKSEGGLDGFPNVGVIRIGAEVMRYDSISIGTTTDSFNIISRGIDSTSIAPHSANSRVYWSYHPTYTTDTIFVQSTAGFPISGRLKINSEEIWYNSKTGNSFKGIVRGIYTDDAYKTITPVVAHINGTEVIDSLYKVIMNDADLDGPKDFNNDKNEDSIVKTWTDDLYYGEEASAYFYYLFTYDDVLNYSDGKFASVNSMTLKRYTPPSGTGITAPPTITYSNINLGNRIDVKGGDTLFFTVEGGSPKFGWVASAAGLQLETAPIGYDTKGESDRYISYTVPDIPEVDQKDIIITVTDSSANAQTLSVILFVTEVTPYLDADLFNVTSDIGTPPVKTNKDTTVRVTHGDVITFTAGVPPTGNLATVIWGFPGPNTFGGQVTIVQPHVLRYTAINPAFPTLDTGADIIAVTDGTSIIRITIIVEPDTPPIPPCSTADPLTVVPGTKGSILVSPGASVTFTAQGGTCSFQWSLIANNSEGSTLTKTDAVHAIYTAGSINRTVDVIELSDGVNTKRIEVHVVSSSSGGGGGCFIRPTASQRD